MHLRIVAKPFSLSGKKIIYLDNQELYYAITDSIAGQECVKLINRKDNIVQTIIVRELFILQDSYSIRFLNRENMPVSFKRMEQWTHNYVGKYCGDTYVVKENKSKIYTVAKNETEIALWLKPQKIFLGNEDNFVLYNNSADLELVLSLCLIIHQKESGKRNPG
jgi:hypothetical protein